MSWNILDTKTTAIKSTADTALANAATALAATNASLLKLPAVAATTVALPANTYANGTAGVGATITCDANTVLPNIDGVALIVGDRLIVKDEVLGEHNGIYTVTSLGVNSVSPFILTRATDADATAKLLTGMTCFVTQGTTLNGVIGVLTSVTPLVVGTDAQVFGELMDKAAYDAAVITANAALLRAGGTMTGTIAMGTHDISGGGTATFTTFSGALSGNATTATSATTATNAVNTAITDDTSTNATMYPTWATAATGNLPQKVSSTKLSFNPSTGTLTTTTFAGALSGNATTSSSTTGNAATVTGLTVTGAGLTVTTNAGTIAFTGASKTLTVPLDASVSGTHSGTSSGSNTGDQSTITGNAGSATILATTRAIYGNNFDGSAALSQIIASTYGGTGNGFAKFSGPTTAERTFTLPDANATILYSGSALGTPSGGTASNLTGLPLTSGVTGTLPVANGGTGTTTSTGTTNVVLSNSPTLVTPVLGAASATSISMGGKITTLTAGTAAGDAVNAGQTAPLIVCFNNGPSAAYTGATYYLDPFRGSGAAASLSESKLILPAGTINAMYVAVSVNSLGTADHTKSLTFTVKTGTAGTSSNTSITCAIYGDTGTAGGYAAASDTSHTAVVTAGTQVSILMAGVAGNGAVIGICVTLVMTLA